MSNRLNVLGYGQADIDAMLDARHRLDGYFMSSNPRDVAVAALAKIAGRSWYSQMYLPKPESVPMGLASDQAG